MNDFVLAIRKVLGQNSYRTLFVFFAVVIFWLFLAVPVYTIPGNDFAFQLSILGTQGILLLVLLSVVTSLLATFHIYILKHKGSLRTSSSLVGETSGGLLAGSIATVFGTATCAACVSSIFGFLGVGGVLFLVQYRLPITVTAIVLLVVSLYFTSRKVLGICTGCHVGGEEVRKSKL